MDRRSTRPARPQGTRHTHRWAEGRCRRLPRALRPSPVTRGGWAMQGRRHRACPQGPRGARVPAPLQAPAHPHDET